MSADHHDRGAHLDPATIAALADGRVPAEERPRLEAHLATCERCYEVLADTLAVTGASTPAAADLEPAAATPKRAAPGDRRRLWLAGLAAAAAIFTIVWLRPFGLAFTPSQRAAQAVATLADAVGDERLTIGRLTAPFAWAAAPSATRSGSDRTATSVDVADAVVRIRRAAEGRSSAAALHAMALAELASGRTVEALAAFEAAVRADPADAAIRINYTAALLDRWRQTNRPADAQLALNQAELAAQGRPDDPAALFNRAYALEAMGMAAEAIAAWTAVRDRDPGSEWAREADEHLARLRGRVDAERPDRSERALWDLLMAWAAATSAEPSPLPAAAEELAGQMRAAGRDAFLPDLVRAAGRTAAPAERACAARVVRDYTASREAFDRSDYAASTVAAEGGTAAARCARIGPEPLHLRAAWAMFFEQRRADALALVRAHLDAAAARGYSRSVAMGEYLVGVEARDKARMNDSLERFARASTWAARAGDLDLLSTIATGAAESLMHAGSLEDAWTFHGAALADLHTLSPRRRHIVLVGSLLTSLARQHAGAALLFADLVAANARGWGLPSSLVSNDLRRAQAFALAGRLDEARAAIARAEAGLGAIATDRERARYRAEIALFQGQALSSADPAAAVDRLTRARALFDEIPMPFRTPEVLLARGRAHQAAGRLDDARADWRAGIEVFESQAPGVRDDQLRITRASALWDLFGELIRLEHADALASLSISERARGRALLDALARREVIAPLQGAAMHDWLPAHVAVVAYTVLPDRLLRWHIRSTGVEVDTLAWTGGDVDAAVSSFVADVRGGRDAGDNGRRLATALLPATLTRAPTTDVVFLPDGSLNKVPFGSLPSPGAGATASRLEAAVTTSVGASLTLLKRAASAPASVSSRRALLIGYGEARSSPPLPALPAVSRELNAVAAAYARTSRLDGAAATPEAIVRALPEANVIHVAGHALADEVLPSESRLLVAPGAARSDLRAEDLAGVRLQPRTVVVLSGCDTARGRVYRGEGALTLARPFLAAGASAVVATLWPVRDDALVGVLARFHRHLQEGLDAPRALARARQDSTDRARRADEQALIVIGMGGAE